MLPKQRGREAQNIAVDPLAFRAELAAYRPEVQRIASKDSPLARANHIQPKTSVKDRRVLRLTVLTGVPPASSSAAHAGIIADVSRTKPRPSVRYSGF